MIEAQCRCGWAQVAQTFQKALFRMGRKATFAAFSTWSAWSAPNPIASHGRYGHLDAPQYISLLFFHTNFPYSTAHG